MNKNIFKKVLFILLTLLILSGVSLFFISDFFEVEEVSLTELTNQINEEKVDEIEIEGQLVTVTLKGGEKVELIKEPEGTFSETITNYGADEEKLKEINIVQKNEISINIWTILLFLAVFLLLIGLIVYFAFRKTGKLKYFSKLRSKLFGSTKEKDEDYNEEKLLSLLNEEESKNLEFKSSLQWDHNQGKVNKELKKIIAKTVAAFLNTEGGILFIGVSDNGEVIGLEEDINSFNSSKDKFLKKLSETINKHLGPDNHALIVPRFLKKDQKDICVLKINRSNRPVYLKDRQKNKFYIRTQNSSMELAGTEADQYKEKRF
jgi:hypothetical protein